MNETNKIVLGIAVVVALALLLLLGGGVMTGVTMSGGMMGSGTMGGVGWMWLPASLMLGLVVLLVWAIIGQKK